MLHTKLSNNRYVNPSTSLSLLAVPIRGLLMSGMETGIAELLFRCFLPSPQQVYGIPNNHWSHNDSAGWSRDFIQCFDYDIWHSLPDKAWWEGICSPASQYNHSHDALRYDHLQRLSLLQRLLHHECSKLSSFHPSENFRLFSCKWALAVPITLSPHGFNSHSDRWCAFTSELF